ncbi:hypothetical protein Pse7367_2707 [Thalassoporum mexicanum PCC 7367]|uniref:hypothetical protein n=1 Tax=Thalassoporum mexicanum TaxID=3457544 RepID=UPI00029FA4E4|nr:hypothetical protein [Pseudanabaena sp. PCC 7367]AFY70962.1 hypothetical protein Pse7367_2707 [Pseudanabaena sp. PCC 7367]
MVTPPPIEPDDSPADSIAISDRPLPKIGLVFLVLWVIANIFTTSISGQNSIAVGKLFSEPIGVFISYGFIGAIVGAGQWLLLRKVVKRSKWWIPLTALAETAVAPFSLTIAFKLSLATGALIDLIAVSAIIRGASVGLFQWTMLYGQFPRAATWIVAVAASRCISALIGTSAIVTQSIDYKTVYILTNAISGLLSGLILVWLLQARSPQPKVADDIKGDRQDLNA